MKVSRGLIYANIISALIFIFLAVEVIGKGFVLGLDRLVNSAILPIQNLFFIHVFKVVGIVFDTIGMSIFTLAVSATIWRRKSKKDGYFFIILMALQAVVSSAIKAIINRQRPANALVATLDQAFPSGHTASAVVFFGLLIYFTLKYVKTKNARWALVAVCVIMPFIIAFSRLYLNVHWFSDVLAGFALGLFTLTIGLIIRQHWLK